MEKKKDLRTSIAYWFFLLAGMGGIVMQGVKFYNDELPLSFAQGAFTVFCGMFIFKPMILLSLLEDLRSLKSGKSN